MSLREKAYSIGKEYDADEFDIEEALYWYCSDWHGGQRSEEYSILSTSPFKPSPFSRGPDGDISQLIYEDLEASQGVKS